MCNQQDYIVIVVNVGWLVLYFFVMTSVIWSLRSNARKNGGHNFPFISCQLSTVSPILSLLLDKWGMKHSWHHVSLCLQFALCPLLPEIATFLHLTKSNVWLTNIYSMVGGIPMGLVLGPLCDQYGMRILITHSLVGGAIPCLCIGLITNLLYMGKCADCCCNNMLDLY
jgi:hypothetical protein